MGWSFGYIQSKWGILEPKFFASTRRKLVCGSITEKTMFFPFSYNINSPRNDVLFRKILNTFFSNIFLLFSLWWSFSVCEDCSTLCNFNLNLYLNILSTWQTCFQLVSEKHLKFTSLYFPEATSKTWKPLSYRCLCYLCFILLVKFVSVML